MNKQYQTLYASQGFPFKGNPKQIVIHSLERTLANYNQASFNMAKNDLKQQLVSQELLKLSFFSHKNCHVCDIC